MPILPTLVVFIFLMATFAAVGYKLWLAPKRSTGVEASPGTLPVQPAQLWPESKTEPPAPQSPAPQSPGDSGMFCPLCGVRSGSDLCSGCGFDLKFLRQQQTAPVVQPVAQSEPAAPAAKKRAQNGIWPIITDAESARFAARQGMWASFFCAGMTLAFLFLAHAGMALIEGVDQRELMIAGLYVVLGVAILRMSRIAAVGALGTYLFVRFVWSSGAALGGPSILVMAVLILFFVSAIRGTFAYQEYKDKIPDA
jgi:hypothetical protein